MKTQGSVLERCISRFLISFVFLSTVIPISGAWANPMIQSFENRSGPGTGLFLEPRASYFATSSNYDSGAKLSALPNAGSVNQTYLDLNASYGLTEDFFLNARFSLLLEHATSSLQTLSQFGLGDQLLGASYRVLRRESGLGLSLQFDAVIPAYQNANAQTNANPYLGDESTDFTTGGFLEIPTSFGISALKAEVGLGYTYRSKGYSSAVPLSFFFKRLPPRRGLTFSLGARGQVSLKTDATKNSAAGLSLAQQLSTQGAVGSNLIDAINPSWWLGQGSIGYEFAPGREIHLTAAAPFSGSNSAGGFQVSLGVSLAFGVSENPAAKSTGSLLNRRRNSQPRNFSTYDQDAKVTSVNDQLYLVKIDQGSSDTIELGQTFDIFNGNDLIARAKVMSVKDDEAALNVVEYYQDHSIETGFTARRLVQ